jgi:hypothetical protein
MSPQNEPASPTYTDCSRLAFEKMMAYSIQQLSDGQQISTDSSSNSEDTLSGHDDLSSMLQHAEAFAQTMRNSIREFDKTHACTQGHLASPPLTTATTTTGTEPSLKSVLQAFTEVVKMDHLIWKMDLYKVLMKVSTAPIEAFTDHHSCRLGQWYYEEDGRKIFSTSPLFQALETPHVQVHTSGIAALVACRQGDMEALETSLMRMEEASIEVLNLLEQLTVTL